MKKPIPDPTPKAFHDLLDKACTTVVPAVSAPEIYELHASKDSQNNACKAQEFVVELISLGFESSLKGIGYK